MTIKQNTIWDFAILIFPWRHHFYTSKQTLNHWCWNGQCCSSSDYVILLFFLCFPVRTLWHSKSLPTHQIDSNLSQSAVRPAVGEDEQVGFDGWSALWCQVWGGWIGCVRQVTSSVVSGWVESGSNSFNSSWTRPNPLHMGWQISCTLPLTFRM